MGLARKQATRRLVEIIAVDRDVNVPFDKAVIFQGERRITDLSDHELMFEAKLDEALATYNQYRVTVRDEDRSATARSDVYLKPLRLKDLRAIVITHAAWETTSERE